MFFIVGFSNRDEFIKEVNFKCTNCLNEKFELYQVANVLTFFFIPLFKFNKKALIVCKNCKSIYKVKSESLKKILDSSIVTYDDIEEIVRNNNVCPNCGYMIDKNDKFCPNCGNKL
ncbi:zinc ribbon domain-containing protein [Fusobacterium perfoetens]|uniref:zinc ribbon domain-containing protein n=1 Tax=Fusobacterium perfoetens TaxID=852 RepID=UPI0004818FB9|nr:zinc ribbon domain-containing protein [Fusobacterium perfoetens]MCI6151880.1 zinc ribbon domain-containing protein [Fusobacterium perfoetens]MDY3238220.1 zinc ribbon domain-containing protein [Fusobacterium perfoetens]